MKHNFFDRNQQTATYWLMKVVFIFIVALLFILPLYDLITGRLAYNVWTMLIISSLLLLYEYIMIYLTGEWEEDKQRMRVPTYCFISIMLVIVACCIAFCLDVFSATILNPYIIPLIVALLGMIITVLIHSNSQIKSRKIK